MQSNADLKSRDLLMVNTKKYIQSVELTITFTILEEGDRRVLVIDNIPAESLGNLFFFTNTDQNNNYLYIKSLTISIAKNVTDIPIDVSGLSALAKEL